MKLYRQILQLLTLLLASCLFTSCHDDDELIDEPTEQTVIFFMPWSTNMTPYFEQNIADFETAIKGGLLKNERVIVRFGDADFIGYEDDSFYYLLNEAAHRAVRKFCDEQGELFAISSRALPKALAEEGLTEITDGENTRSVRFRNGTRRVVCLYKERARQIIEGGMS